MGNIPRYQVETTPQIACVFLPFYFSSPFHFGQILPIPLNFHFTGFQSSFIRPSSLDAAPKNVDIQSWLPHPSGAEYPFDLGSTTWLFLRLLLLLRDCENVLGRTPTSFPILGVLVASSQCPEFKLS